MPDPIIRPATAADVPAMAAIYNHYVEHSHATFDIEPVSLENRRAWFSGFAPAGPFRLLVAERDAEILGYSGSGRFREKAAYLTSVEMTVYLRPDAVGDGLGRRLYEALFERLAPERIHRYYAGITLPNERSVALHRRFGFLDIGTYDEVGFKFERYWSVLWLERRAP